MLSSNDGSNYIQVSSLVINIIHAVLGVDKLVRDKPLKTAFGSSEKPFFFCLFYFTSSEELQRNSHKHAYKLRKYKKIQYKT